MLQFASLLLESVSENSRSRVERLESARRGRRSGLPKSAGMEMRSGAAGAAARGDVVGGGRWEGSRRAVAATGPGGVRASSLRADSARPAGA
jgi:hypothetical protein